MQIVSWMVPFVFVVLGEATMTGRSTKQLSDLRRAWILHPALVYAITWGIVLIMVLASMATFMSEASPTLLLLIGGNILLFGLITFLVQRLRPVRTRISSPDCLQRQLDRIMHFASILLPVWVIGVIGNTIASGGLPLVWLLQGDSARSYVDYGLPTLSGLLNAIGLFLANVVLIEYLMTGVKRHLWVIAAVIALQVLTINRGGVNLGRS